MSPVASFVALEGLAVSKKHTLLGKDAGAQVPVQHDAADFTAAGGCSLPDGIQDLQDPRRMTVF